jgi:hypothetical protein
LANLRNDEKGQKAVLPRESLTSLSSNGRTAWSIHEDVSSNLAYERLVVLSVEKILQPFNNHQENIILMDV